ncbi:MAG: hypothetical protein GC204_06835 [Chloroflexi bacterium]|nr:hypothetical protein [Chloroflexota bacterium]
MNDAWLTEACRDMLQRCRITAYDGTALFTPDGVANYHALWTRDFSYMVENAGDLIDPAEIRAAIRYLLNGQREDGCIPDRVQGDGIAVYSAGPLGKPLGDPPTDNSQFMVKLVYDYATLTGDHAFACQQLDALRQALDFTRRDANGLVNIVPGQPQSPYGFTDTIGKTGGLLFSSLLYWQACQQMIEMSGWCGTDASLYAERAAQARRGLDALWDEEKGMFLASTLDCRQIDIWGNAFAVYIGAVEGERRERILRFLRDHYDEYMLRGQVRHLLKGEYWQRVIAPPEVIAPETYQNGAYWATASGWVIAVLNQIDPALAQKTAAELVADFQAHGIWECVNVGGYQKVEHYVVSITNPRGVLMRL